MGQAVQVTTTLQATSSVARELFRLLAVGCAMAVGLVGCSFAIAGGSHQVTMVQVRQLWALALLLVVGLLTAWAVPGVRWRAAVAGVVGVTGASVMAFTAADALRAVWDILTAHTALGHTGLLVTLPATLVSAVVASALLRTSTGGALLPGRPVQSVRPAALRVIALGAAITAGTSLLFAASLLGEQLLSANQPRPFVAEDVRVTVVTTVMSLAVLAMVGGPARLRRPDAVVLVAAGLVAYPLFLLTAIPFVRIWPSPSLMVLLALALAVGVASTVWMARSRRSERRAETVAGR